MLSFGLVWSVLYFFLLRIFNFPLQGICVFSGKFVKDWDGELGVLWE